MRIIDSILDFTSSLDLDSFRKYVLLSTCIVLISVSGASYLIHQAGNNYINQIKSLKKLSMQTSELIDVHQKIQSRTNKLYELLEKEKGFDLKGFFESFYRSHNIAPQSNWANVVESDISEDLIEITLNTTIKNLTTEKLVRMLEDIYIKQIVHVKKLKINRVETSKKISIDITLATLRKKEGVS